MIGIAGYIRVPASARGPLQPHIATYVPSCRQEPGCDVFELSYDALDYEILRVFEVWKDEESLQNTRCQPTRAKLATRVHPTRRRRTRLDAL